MFTLHDQNSQKQVVVKEFGRRPAVRAISGLVANARFLVVQERCRICERFIHPEIARFEYDKYAPPGRYLINGKMLESETICRNCCKTIRFSRALWTNIFATEGERVIRAIPVFSGTKFDHEAKSLIHAFKYDGDILLAKDLTVLAWRAWRLLTRNVAINKWSARDKRPLLVPVPLHWWRERRRGFNQSELIAKGLSGAIGLQVSTNSLTRKKNTRPQQELTRLERASNLTGAFEANVAAVEGKSIILVDDVCTTGATLIECAQVLRNVGAINVIALTLARVELS